MEDVILIKLRSRSNYVTPPLGIGYLLKAIENIDDINPVFIDCQRDKITERALLERIKTMKPLVVGFQVFSIDYFDFRRILPEVRRIHPDAKIIAGGPHVSGLAENTLMENPELDYGVKGEGEEALEKLIYFLRRAPLNGGIRDIPNLVHRSSGKIAANESSFIDVDKYGAPAWERLQPDRYPLIQHGQFHRGRRAIPIITSRGCPCPCTYCGGHLITGRKVRARNADSIVNEIEFLRSRYRFEEFIIEDDNFSFYKEHVFNLTKKLNERRIKCYFSLPNGLRFDTLDDDIVACLKEMGTYMVTLGIESASKKTLKAMKRSPDLEAIKEKVDLLHKYKIIVHGSFILGFSNETMEDITNTVGFALSSGIDTAYFGNYIPLPGTEDFNRMSLLGELKLREIDWATLGLLSFGRIPYHPRDIPERDLIKAIRWATIKFYSRPKIIFNFLKRISKPVFLRTLMLRIIMLFTNEK